MRADARKNYDLLIEVARDVFVEQGAEASLRDIARRAGVGMGTLYRHFPNRDSLLEALLRSRFAALTARAESLLLAADPAAALLAGRERGVYPSASRDHRPADERHRRS